MANIIVRFKDGRKEFWHLVALQDLSRDITMRKFHDDRAVQAHTIRDSR